MKTKNILKITIAKKNKTMKMKNLMETKIIEIMKIAKILKMMQIMKTMIMKTTIMKTPITKTPIFLNMIAKIIMKTKHSFLLVFILVKKRWIKFV